MESAFGWTQIARSDVAKAAELLKSGERGVRDEIGFLAIHQGFADRFFPGTSVLQTRLRYVLFVPWQMEDLGRHPRVGEVPAEQRLKRAERNLVSRFHQAERGVIGRQSPRHEAAQPPSIIYWTALKRWGILNPLALDVWPGRGEVLGKIDAGGDWDEDQAADHTAARMESTFFALPPRPSNWYSDSPLDFRLSHTEQKYLMERIETARRIAPGAHSEESLLSRLAKSKKRPRSWLKAGYESSIVKALADAADREALNAAAAASSLAHIGRAVYGALLEWMAAKDGRKTTGEYVGWLAEIVAEKRNSALKCKLDEVQDMIGKLDAKFRAALDATLDWLRTPDADVGALWKPYYESEEWRKGMRARLPRTPHAKALRAAWLTSGAPRADYLNYRWHRVGQLLDDLHGIHD